MSPDKKIITFLKKHHVLTLATSAGDFPWCSNMFYAYDSKADIFIFTSDDHTRHVKEAIANPRASASIVLETRMVGRLQGIQITGTLSRAGEGSGAREIYLKRFPFAAVADLNLWILRPDHMKYTDNTLGFGKKLLWNRNDD